MGEVTMSRRRIVTRNLAKLGRMAHVAGKGKVEKKTLPESGGPQVRMRRVASLNAMAKVHILYENEARSPNTSTGTPSDEDNQQTVALARRRKAPVAEVQSTAVATVTAKRMANLNAVAILAASYCPDWARAHKTHSTTGSMSKSKKAKEDMAGKEKLKSAARSKKTSRKKKEPQNSRPLAKVTRAATRDAQKFDDNSVTAEEEDLQCHHLRCPWDDYEPLKPESKMGSKGSDREDAEEVTITGMYINPTTNTSQSFCISGMHHARKLQEAAEGEVAANSPVQQQMQHAPPQHVTVHAGNIIFHHPAPSPETCVNLGVGVPMVNVPLPRHFRSAFSVPHYNRHGTLSYTHGYFQPAGPLIQALPETCLIHKPIPFHPHGCSADPSGNPTQTSAAYFTSTPRTPVHVRCKRKHEAEVFSVDTVSVPVTCPVKVEPPRPPDSPPPSSAGSLSPLQSPSITPPSSLYVRAGVGSGRALRVAVKVEDVLHQGYAGFSKVPSACNRNRVFLHRLRGPRLCSSLSLSSPSSSASSTSSYICASSPASRDSKGSARSSPSPASKRPFPRAPSPTDSVPRQRIIPRHSNGWTWDGKPYDHQVTLHNDDPPVPRTCYPAMRHTQGDVIRNRDCVLLKSGSRKSDLPFVAKVTALWENPDDGEMMASLLWYYRPEHTDQGRKPTHMDDEIFASKHCDVNSVACIEDKCYVLTFNEYCRYRGSVKVMAERLCRRRSAVPEPEEPYVREQRQPHGDIPSDMVFFCRRVYDFRQKRLLKNPS